MTTRFSSEKRGFLGLERVKGIEPSSRFTSFAALEAACFATFEQIELAMAVVTCVVTRSERNTYGQSLQTR